MPGKGRILQRISLLLVFVIFMLSCFYAGAFVEQRMERVTNETTERIALVNLDEGVMSGENRSQRIYYSNELLGYNRIKPEAVSLESARNGIVEGRFGAYIILPANFSKQVESVSERPQKPEISYAVNPYLDQTVREKVIKSLQDFCDDMDYDISYIYVSAILQEFHDVQDASGVVLKNDARNEKELLAVESEKLIGAFSYPELVQTKKKIEDLDFAEVFVSNQSIKDGILQELKEDLQAGKEAYKEVKEQSAPISDATDGVLAAVKGYTPGYDAEGEPVYQEGIRSVSENFAKYNLSQAENRKAVKNLAESDMRENVRYALYSYRQLLLQGLENYLASVSANGLQAEELLEGLVSGNEIEKILEGAQVSDELTRTIEGASGVSVNDLTAIVDREIVGELKKQQTQAYRSIQEKKTTLEKRISDYDKLIGAYDPYDYIREEKLDEGLDALKENIGNVEKEQKEHDGDYLELIQEVYETTGENQEAFDKNLEESQKITKENVEKTIAVLKGSKQETTKENKALLEEFTKKLTYTRLGSMEDVKAYDFIVSPVDFRESAVEEQIIRIKSSYQKYILLFAAVFAVAAAVLYGVSAALQREERRAKEDTVS